MHRHVAVISCRRDLPTQAQGIMPPSVLWSLKCFFEAEVKGDESSRDIVF